MLASWHSGNVSSKYKQAFVDVNEERDQEDYFNPTQNPCQDWIRKDARAYHNIFGPDYKASGFALRNVREVDTFRPMY